jgi:hypothetical protein
MRTPTEATGNEPAEGALSFASALGPGGTRLYKEVRDVLPMVAGALLTIILPGLIWRRAEGEFAYLIFGLGCALMAGHCFGGEFQHRTLPLLLSQPVPRSRAWRDKMLVLAAGILGNLAVLICLARFCHWSGFTGGVWLVLALIALCAFCGTPYWTLLTRHGIAGVAFSGAVPASLLIIGALLLAAAEHWNAFVAANLDDVSAYGAIILMLAYCPLVYWRGYTRFMNLQDVNATGTELRLPDRLEALLVTPWTRLSAGLTSPFANLLKKEFRVQQATFLLAGTFCLLCLSALVVALCWQHRSRELGEGLFAMLVSIYAVLLPPLAGAVSLAEERGWGVADWHLTLPPPVWQQWAAKMLVTLPSSAALGVLLPLVSAWFGSYLFHDPSNDHSLITALPLLLLGQLVVTSLAVFTASFSTTALRAILLALGLVALVGCAVASGIIGARDLVATLHQLRGFAAPPGYALSAHRQILGWVQTGVGLFLLLGLSQLFAFSNFRHRGLSPVRFVLQALAIVLFAGLLAFLIVINVLT